jgi:hypothetical protein
MVRLRKWREKVDWTGLIFKTGDGTECSIFQCREALCTDERWYRKEDVATLHSRMHQTYQFSTLLRPITTLRLIKAQTMIHTCNTHTIKETTKIVKRPPKYSHNHG